MDIAQENLNAARLEVQDALRKFRLSILAQTPAPLRGQVGNLETVWLLCWLLRDLGWALYCWPLAWPTAAIAMGLQVYDFLLQWDTAPIHMLVHNWAILGWLAGSSVWMTVQLLFEPEVHAGRASPWYSGAIVTANPTLYQYGVCLASLIYVAALVFISAFYVTSLKNNASLLMSKTPWASLWAVPEPSNDAACQQKAPLSDSEASSAADGPQKDADAVEPPRLVFGLFAPAVYAKMFVLPWLLKDLFCITGNFVPAIFCTMVVIVLMADNLFLLMQWKDLAVLLWATGNAVWIAHDLVMRDEEIWPLMVAVLVFVIGACILGATLIRPPIRTDGLKQQMASSMSVS